ncbi:MAG: hypothetical protein KDA88_05310 [Planctomycetaceae bacterium]|nr:hypothetical protein [Planctomycetaceae bacterium]MCB9949719.1 hypothetical protein [Planctomycetaceae bacterium]
MSAETPITVTLGSDTRETFEAGHYRATFKEFTGPVQGEPTQYTDGKPSVYYKFEFLGEDGKTHVGFCDQPKSGPKIGERSNKFGRWLAGLAGKPMTQEFSITPSDFYGKPYLLFYSPNAKGRITLNTFSPAE